MVKAESQDNDPEEPGYYDFMARMGTPYFHFGGLVSTRQLADLCKIDKSKEVLAVGCGTGYSVIELAKEYGCKVVGVDISEVMIERAHQRLAKENLGDQVKFHVANAHELPFEDNRFDVVITEFVSIFLDKQQAFREFFRVLRPGGYAGVNELSKVDEIPEEAQELIRNAEEGLQEGIRLPFQFPTSTEWKTWFTQAGFQDIYLERIENKYSFKEYVKAVGGGVKTTKMIFRSMYNILFNGKMRSRLMKMGRGKDVILRNKKTRDYLGSVFCVGKKPL
jgi:ubiquinone/menaquinone biosynthesis C-methylase UbiE